MSYPSKGAWAFRNLTRDFAFWPTLDSIDISESHPSDIATMSVAVVDRNGTLVFDNEDVIRCTFDGVRIFEGHVKRVNEDILAEVGDERVYGLECQDYTAKLDDSIIDHTAERAAESFASRITWILSFLNFGITTAGVDAPAGTAEAATFDGMTVREALDAWADEARAFYYVDFSKDLHAFRTETQAAPFDLDDEDPDYSTSFPFTSYSRSRDSVDLATAAYVQGDTGIAWIVDTAAVDAWGRQERAVNDASLKTAGGIEAAGARALAQQSEPVIEGSLTCHEPGLRAGMNPLLTMSRWGLAAETIYLTSVQISAIDPHDSTGKAYLRCEIQFTDRRRAGGGGRGGGSHRDQTNKNTRKRDKPLPDLPPEDAWQDADVIPGAAVVIYPVMRGRMDEGWVGNPSENGWDEPAVVGGPTVGSWIQENTPYTSTGCPLGSGLWGPGGRHDEAWYPVTIPAGIGGVIITIPALSGGKGLALTTGRFRVGWALDVTPGRPGAWVSVGQVGMAGGVVHISGSVMVPSSAGGAGNADNWLVLAPSWHYQVGWSTCGGNLAFPFNGPDEGGEGNSGSAVPPGYGSFTLEAWVTDGPGRTSWVSPVGAGVPDGTQTVWTLADWNGEGIPEARWGVVILALGTDYTYDATAKTVTFREPPPEGTTTVSFRYRVD